MQYYGNLKTKLKTLAFKKIIISLLIVTFLLISTLLLSNKIINHSIVSHSNQEITSVFQTLYDNNDTLSKAPEISNYILNPNSDDSKLSIENRLRRFNINNIASTNILLYDTELNLLYSTYLDKQETYNRRNYSSAILSSLSNRVIDETYNSVYKVRNGFPDLMVNREIYHEGKSIGYVSLFISGHDFSYYLLSNYNNDSIITDQAGNIIFYTRSLLLDNNYQFNAKGNSTKLNKQRYHLASFDDGSRNVIISTLSNQEDYSLYVFLILSILIVGILWYRNSIKITSVIIDKNIDSVNQLIDQINLIQDDSYGQRISMNTEDEYEIIEQHINSMLDRLSELNAKNIELVKLNSIIEMKQLLLQYHPHFLYNTLEIIRASIYFQPEVADDIIIQLTRILKYSIENPLKDINFKKDFKYIEDYLKIQKARFANKFNYSLEIKESAYNCIIPKLLLQPVIENSIKYGFKSQEIINIKIVANKVDDILILQVIDDGPGMSEEDIINLNQ